MPSDAETMKSVMSMDNSKLPALGLTQQESIR